jgi:hypothetical protein
MKSSFKSALVGDSPSGSNSHHLIALSLPGEENINQAERREHLNLTLKERCQQLENSGWIYFQTESSTVGKMDNCETEEGLESKGN